MVTWSRVHFFFYLSLYLALCGNKKLDLGEECDGGANCTASCRCRTGTSPRSPPAFSCSPSLASCGNGKLDKGEECDGGKYCNSCVCGAGSQPTKPRSLTCADVGT